MSHNTPDNSYNEFKLQTSQNLVNLMNLDFRNECHNLYCMFWDT